MSIENILETNGIHHHLLPHIMGFIGPQAEVDKIEVQVLQCFMFMRSYERKLGDGHVEYIPVYKHDKHSSHAQIMIDMIPKLERKRRLRRMKKIFTGLVDSNPTEDLLVAQNAFIDTWVGKLTTSTYVKRNWCGYFGQFANTGPLTETKESLEERLRNYNILVKDALIILKHYNPPDN